MVFKTKKLVDFVVENGVSDKYGARHMKKFIRKHIAVPVANAILSNKVPKGKDKLFRMNIENGKPVIINSINLKEKTDGRVERETTKD